MLNCILGMVDKTKRALSILQQRNVPSSSSPISSAGLHGFLESALLLNMEIRVYFEGYIHYAKL